MSRHVLLVAFMTAALMLLLPRACNSPKSAARELTVAVARHDSTTHGIEARIKEQRVIAGNAAQAATVARRRADVAVGLYADHLEEDTIVSAILAAKDSALALGDIQTAALETALDLSEVRAAEADSLLHVSLDVVRHPCRILRLVPCPSRTATAAVSAVAAIAVLRRR